MKTFRTQLLLILSLTFLNLVLFLVNIGAIELPSKTPRRLDVQTPREIAQIKVGKEVKIAGYKIKFTNPRYEFDEDYLFDSFKVDAKIKNESVKPSLAPVFNCDIVDSGEIVKEGSGVILDESHPLLAGESHDYVVTVNLEIDYSKPSQAYSKDDENQFPDRRVSACRFTPTGSYDPNISVEVKFEW